MMILSLSAALLVAFMVLGRNEIKSSDLLLNVEVLDGIVF